MPIARSTAAVHGTDESTLSSVANNATLSGSELDLLGDNASGGNLTLYVVVTSTVTVGSIDLTLRWQRVTGATYTQPQPSISFPPINGTVRYAFGPFPVADRRLAIDLLNNATGAAANVFVGYTLEKFT